MACTDDLTSTAWTLWHERMLMCLRNKHMDDESLYT